MKTIFSTRSFFVFAFAAILLASCSKETDNLVLNPAPPTAVQSGSIIDLGSLENGVRVMNATLVKQNFLIDDSNGGSSESLANIDVIFYVNEDGQIPSGEYVYSNSDSKLPFTFDSAVLTGVPGSDGSSVNDGVIMQGSIVVTHLGDNNYHFEFKGQLDSGPTFNGSFESQMTYSDEF